jgi:hypothetical protein
MNVALHAIALVPIFLFGAVYIVAGPRSYHRQVFATGAGPKTLFSVLIAGAVGVVLDLCLTVFVLSPDSPNGWPTAFACMLLLLGALVLAIAVYWPGSTQETWRLNLSIRSTGLLFVGYVQFCISGLDCLTGDYVLLAPFHLLFYVVATAGSAWLHFRTGVETPWVVAAILTLISVLTFFISVSVL